MHASYPPQPYRVREEQAEEDGKEQVEHEEQPVGRNARRHLWGAWEIALSLGLLHVEVLRVWAS